MRLPIVLAAATLASCATAADTSGPVQKVTFETEACYGSCPVFSITVDAEGNGTYRGKHYVAKKGDYTFTATPAQLQAFLDRLAPFRPDGKAAYGYERCSGPIATDNAAVNVTWEADGKMDSLSWYLGCEEPALIEIEPDLYSAWGELPIHGLVGTNADRFDYERGKN